MIISDIKITKYTLIAQQQTGCTNNRLYKTLLHMTIRMNLQFNVCCWFDLGHTRICHNDNKKVNMGSIWNTLFQQCPSMTFMPEFYFAWCVVNFSLHVNPWWHAWGKASRQPQSCLGYMLSCRRPCCMKHCKTLLRCDTYTKLTSLKKSFKYLGPWRVCTHLPSPERKQTNWDY